MAQFPKYFELLLCSKKALARAEAEGQAQPAKAPPPLSEKVVHLRNQASKRLRAAALRSHLSLPVLRPNPPPPRLSQVISHPVPV
jgi:hypothetical protein